MRLINYLLGFQDKFQQTPLNIPQTSPKVQSHEGIPLNEKEVLTSLRSVFVCSFRGLFGVLVGIFLGSPGISWGLGLGAFPPGVVSCSLPKEQWLFGPWPRKSQKRGGAESCQSRGPSGSKRGGTGGNS